MNLSPLALKARLIAAHHRNPSIFWIRVSTIVAVLILFATKRSFWTPDTLFLVMLAVFVVFGQARQFLIRFAPVVLLLLAYDSFRGIADDLNSHVHYFEMINFDRFLFNGALPTDLLQKLWWHGSVQWYDFYFYFLYTMHFIAPLVLALVVWKFRDKMYWTYGAAFIGLSFAAFLTYLIFPAAPPWMASDMHFIEPIHRISSDVWRAMGITDFSEVYSRFSANEVAAVPSLHAAYPLLVVLFLGKLFTWRRVWWAMIYPISVWVGVIYLGEHYATDVILGIIYALVAYFSSLAYFNWRAKHPSKFKAEYARGYDHGKKIAHSSKSKAK